MKLSIPPPEADDGYVQLVNANISKAGTITESEKKTGFWAWKHPHAADNTVTYTALHGDVEFEDISFSYDGKKKSFITSVSMPCPDRKLLLWVLPVQAKRQLQT